MENVLVDLKKELDNLISTIDIDKHIQEAKRLEQKTLVPDFWNDTQKAQGLIAIMNEENVIIDQYNKIADIYETLELTV